MVNCRWIPESKCPFKDTPSDPRWCQVCVALEAARTQKQLAFTARVSIIYGLIQTYRDEKKAKEVYEQLKQHALKW